MRVLADTSIWVEFFRRPKGKTARALDRLLERREVVMCGPVAAELLAGTRADQQDDLWMLLVALPWAELDRDAWRTAGELAHRLRRQGITVGLTDLAIAVAALAADAALWSRDADLGRVGAVADIKTYEPRA